MFVDKQYRWVPTRQVDFTKEATHIAEFTQYLERAGVSGIATCPFVYRAFSSQRCSKVHRLVLCRDSTQSSPKH